MKSDGQPDGFGSRIDQAQNYSHGKSVCQIHIERITRMKHKCEDCGAQDDHNYLPIRYPSSDIKQHSLGKEFFRKGNSEILEKYIYK